MIVKSNPAAEQWGIISNGVNRLIIPDIKMPAMDGIELLKRGKTMMDRSDSKKEKRKSPRHYMDWPLEYRVINDPDAYGGMVVDGSEIGLRIHSVKNIPVGTKLNITVLFPKEFQLTHFEVEAEIVWKNRCLKEDWKGYQYGLKLIQIDEEDLQKLLQLLSSSIPNGEDLK